MYGKTLSIPDSSLELWYSLLLGRSIPDDVGPRDAKRSLARALVERFHSADAAVGAERAFDAIHVRHEVPDDIAEVEWNCSSSSDGPTSTVHVPALLQRAFGISTSEARRVLAQGGVRVDGEQLRAGSLDVPVSEVDGRVLQLGKRRFARVRVDRSGGA